MDCGIQSAILSVPPGTEPGSQPPLTTSVFAPPDVDQAQFEADKRSVYKHPSFPLSALSFERCESATQSSDAQSSEAFNSDIQAFVQHQERDRKPFSANEPEIDGLMIKAIQVSRIHSLESEKVQELCKDFCNRYITCLKGKMQSENSSRSDYPQDMSGASMLGAMESNNNSMMSHGNSESGSASNSPVQYSISPSQQPTMTPQPNPLDRHSESQNYAMPPHHYGGPTPPALQTQAQPPAPCDNSVVHGSTPSSQIGVNVGSVPPSESSGPLSPAPTTPGGSADDCDSDFTTRGGRKQKRGVLPKQATSVMRSWSFQHSVHPYPTEDEKRHIAAQTNSTSSQVNNWFINARRRISQPMSDASAPGESNGGAASPSHRKKKSHNNNRRFWSSDFANMQPQMANGMSSSSDDEGDSYSSDGEEGSSVIDAQVAEGGAQNGRQAEALAYANGAEAEGQ